MQLMLKYQLNSEVAPEFVLLPSDNPVATFTVGYEAGREGFLVKVYAFDPTVESFALVYETPVPDEPTTAARGRRAVGD